MENETQSITSPVQSLSQTPIINQPLPSEKSSKMLLYTVVGAIVIGGSVFAGIQIGKNQIPSQQPTEILPTPSPTLVAVVPTSSPTTSITVTPTVDQTANWKIYFNNEQGFSFKYPETLITRVGSVPEIVYFMNNSKADLFFLGFYKNITNIPQWLRDNQAGKIIDTITINQYEFAVIEGGLMNVSREYAIIVPNTGMLRFVIDPYPNQNIGADLIPQILSTFKITN